MSTTRFDRECGDYRDMPVENCSPLLSYTLQVNPTDDDISCNVEPCRVHGSRSKCPKAFTSGSGRSSETRHCAFVRFCDGVDHGVVVFEDLGKNFPNGFRVRDVDQNAVDVTIVECSLTASRGSLHVNRSDFATIPRRTRQSPDAAEDSLSLGLGRMRLDGEAGTSGRLTIERQTYDSASVSWTTPFGRVPNRLEKNKPTSVDKWMICVEKELGNGTQTSHYVKPNALLMFVDSTTGLTRKVDLPKKFATGAKYTVRLMALKIRSTEKETHNVIYEQLTDFIAGMSMDCRFNFTCCFTGHCFSSLDVDNRLKTACSITSDARFTSV